MSVQIKFVRLAVSYKVGQNPLVNCVIRKKQKTRGPHRDKEGAGDCADFTFSSTSVLRNTETEESPCIVCGG